MLVGRREQRHPDKGRPRRQRIAVNSDNNFTQSWLTHEANSMSLAILYKACILATWRLVMVMFKIRAWKM